MTTEYLNPKSNNTSWGDIISAALKKRAQHILDLKKAVKEQDLHSHNSPSYPGNYTYNNPNLGTSTWGPNASQSLKTNVKETTDLRIALDLLRNHVHTMINAGGADEVTGLPNKPGGTPWPFPASWTDTISTSKKPMTQYIKELRLALEVSNGHTHLSCVCTCTCACTCTCNCTCTSTRGSFASCAP